MNDKEIEDFVNAMPDDEVFNLLPASQEFMAGHDRELGQMKFMEFVKTMWPGFIHGRHHVLMAKKFEEIAAGKVKRLIINMPPRHTKSEFASYMLPAWFLGKFPNKKIGTLTSNSTTHTNSKVLAITTRRPTTSRLRVRT